LKILKRTKTRIGPLKIKPKLKPSSIFEIKRNQNRIGTNPLKNVKNQNQGSLGTEEPMNSSLRLCVTLRLQFLKFYKKIWSNHNYIKRKSEILCVYKFLCSNLKTYKYINYCVFHICQSEIDNKLGNVALEFLHFQVFALGISEKFQDLGI
jgi:hypothetical protein